MSSRKRAVLIALPPAWAASVVPYTATVALGKVRDGFKSRTHLHVSFHRLRARACLLPARTEPTLAGATGQLMPLAKEPEVFTSITDYKRCRGSRMVGQCNQPLCEPAHMLGIAAAIISISKARSGAMSSIAIKDNSCPKCGSELRVSWRARCFGTGRSGNHKCWACGGKGTTTACPNVRSHKLKFFQIWTNFAEAAR
jgi:hypothetical protein